MRRKNILFIITFAIVSVTLSSCSFLRKEKIIRISKKDDQVRNREYVVFPDQNETFKELQNKENANIPAAKIDPQQTEVEFERQESLLFTKPSSHTWNIALLVPLSGKYKSLGEQIVDVAMFTMKVKKPKKVRIFPIDTGETDAQAIEAAQLVLSMNVDVVIGPIFSSTAKIVSPLLQGSGIRMISLSNDTSLARENVYVFGIAPEAMMTVGLSYAKDLQRNNVGFIFPSDQYGYEMSKKAKIISEGLNDIIMSTEFYPRNKDLYAAVASRVLNAYEQTYKQKTDGSVYKEDYRDRAKREKTLKESGEIDKSKEEDVIIRKKMEVLYLDAQKDDFYRMTRELNAIGLFRKDIMFISNYSIVNNDLSLNHYVDGMFFIGPASASISNIEEQFNNIFGYKPTSVALLSYDAIMTVLHMMKKDSLNGKVFIRPNGYSGVFGDFRFTPQGIVQRRFGVYRVQHGRIEMILKSPVYV